eukprot:3242869-Rhodomonas_salina.1
MSMGGGLSPPRWQIYWGSEPPERRLMPMGGPMGRIKPSRATNPTLETRALTARVPSSSVD